MKLRKAAAALSFVFIVGVACTTNASDEEAQHFTRSDPRDTAHAQQKPPTEMAPPANPYRAQIPQFPPTPPPQRVAVHAEAGRVPVLQRIPTTQPVAFITIDDGHVAAPDGATLLSLESVPASAFLVSPAASLHSAFFEQLRDVGVPLQAHTRTHTSLRGMSLRRQKQEICGSVADLETQFGTKPTLFRPPYGEYDTTTQIAAAHCGVSAIPMWTQSVTDGHVYFQTPEKLVKPGDILLLHFRKTLVQDVLAALRAIHDAGLTPALLEDYI